MHGRGGGGAGDAGGGAIWCVTWRRQSKPSNTQESKQRSIQQRTTARSSANLPKPNQTPTRHTRVKDSIILQILVGHVLCWSWQSQACVAFSAYTTPSPSCTDHLHSVMQVCLRLALCSSQNPLLQLPSLNLSLNVAVLPLNQAAQTLLKVEPNLKNGCDLHKGARAACMFRMLPAKRILLVAAVPSPTQGRLSPRIPR